VVTFGPFTLDDRARQLSRGAEPIHLSPKALDLLALLVQRRPEAISKSEMLDKLWPETFISEGNLAVLIKEIRDAMSDNAQSRRTSGPFSDSGTRSAAPPQRKRRAWRRRAGSPGARSARRCWSATTALRTP